MLGKYEYKQMASYPHMGPEDAAIWSRYIADVSDAFDSVDYDVKIGVVPAFVSDGAHGLGADISNLYMRKIDVVGYKDGIVYLCELKPNAGFSAVGQILGYLNQWHTQYGMTPETKAVIITNDAKLDVHMLAEANGVSILTV